MSENGIDIAGTYQPPATLQQYLSQINFGICKATQGNTVIGLHDAQVSMLRSAGKQVGHYDYAEPTHPGKEQAQYFLEFAKAQTGDNLCIDFEPYNSSAPRSAYVPYVCDFAEEIRTAKDCWPWLYANDFHLGMLISLATPAQRGILYQLPLWKAGNNNAYVSSPSVGAGNLHGWKVLTAWQWHATNIDRDIFYGDANVWHRLGVGGLSTVTPPPVVKPPAPVPAPSPILATYTVRSGDTLTSIAERFYHNADWQKIAAFNHLSDPNLIHPGQVLRIPR